MRAMVRQECGRPGILELKDIDKPVAKDDEVLVRVHAAGVNMADVDYLLGRPIIGRLTTGVRAPRNRVLGLDVAGHVEAVGRDVTRFRPGDEVFGDLTEHGCGGIAEYACARSELDVNDVAGPACAGGVAARCRQVQRRRSQVRALSSNSDRRTRPRCLSGWVSV